MNNNKLMKIMLLITAIEFIMISCGTKSALNSIEADEVLIDVSYADESFLRKYSTYDSFIENEEDYAIRLAFTSNIPVKDFSWLSLSLNFDDSDELFYGIDKVLYSLKELHPQKPFVATWVEVGIMSVFGFSYRDKDGQKKYFVGRVGNYGMDEEEYDGPDFVVTQFFPMEIVTGRYEYTAEWPYDEDENTLILDLTETSYTLKVNDVVYTGTAVIDFENGEDSVEWYVKLEGIKWAHNWMENFSHGVPDLEPDKWADEETYVVELWLEGGNELIFQNRGDPMAPYVIFDGIDNKYVTLVK
jgi:hypothetical protein